MWFVIVVLIVSIHVYTIIDVVRISSIHINVLPKKLWALIAFIPIVGPILWFLFGQRDAPFAGNPGAGNFSRPDAPDDDPEFLRILDIQQKQQEEAKRLEKWRKDLQRREQELGKNTDHTDKNDGGSLTAPTTEDG